MQEFTVPLGEHGQEGHQAFTMEIGMKGIGKTLTKWAPPLSTTCAWLATWSTLTSSLAWPRWRFGQAIVSGDKFYIAKLSTARFYFAKLLPETATLIRTARAGLAPLMEMEEELF